MAETTSCRFFQTSIQFNVTEKNIKKNTTIDLPNMDDDVGWCRLCFGNVTTTAEKETINEDGLLPLVSIVCHMSQPLIEQVLDYHLAWFETTGFTEAQGRWFFALLACLEKPLTPDACSSLRTLVRYCANLRAAIDNDDARLPPLNLLICLVTRYFDQFDLADD
uniref:Gem-associated protein 2 n=1 Tax=Strigamia maritima TaxID=126957 RepID=T1IKF6_STRMM